MASPTWGKRYETGIVAVDRQHRRLLRMHDALGRALASGQDDRRLRALLAEFLDETELHFASEELFMRSMDYPGTAGHARAHADLMQYVRFTQEQLERGRKRFNAAILAYLGKWLTDHLAGEDAAYVRFYRMRGKRRRPQPTGSGI